MNRKRILTGQNKDTLPTKNLNASLHKAKGAKQDEFYTQLSDIEKELRHYTGTSGNSKK